MRVTPAGDILTEKVKLLINKEMKVRSILYATLCGLLVTTGFTACSDDNDDDDSWKEGSKVELPQYRAFILCEGMQKQNNSHLFFYDPTEQKLMTDDIYELQNGRKLGDTANDIITANGDIYIVVNVSQLLLRLNGSGVEQARYDRFDADGLGEPRNAVVADGKLFVTCYGGFVARFDLKTLALEAKVTVDANPEQIVELGDSLYCVNSGYGTGHTLSAINVKKFDKAVSHETLFNPYGLQKANGRLYVSAYGADYSNPVGIYDVKTTATKKIGNAGRVLASGDRLYMLNSTSPDWVTYTTTFSVYNATTDGVSAWNLKGAPEAMTTGKVPYFMEVNPVDGSLFIGYTDYFSEGTVYVFDANDSYKATFTVPGINPNGMAFLAR